MAKSKYKVNHNLQQVKGEKGKLFYFPPVGNLSAEVIRILFEDEHASIVRPRHYARNAFSDKVWSFEEILNTQTLDSLFEDED